MRSPFLQRLFSLVTILVLVSGYAPVAADSPDYKVIKYGAKGTDPVPDLNQAWETRFDEKLHWFELAPDGRVLVSDKHSLFALDPVDGKEIWRLVTGKKVAKDRIEFVQGTHLLMHNRDHWNAGWDSTAVELIDMRTGQVVWTSHALGIRETRGHVFIERLGQLIVYARTDSTPRVDRTFALNLDDMSQAWRIEGFLGGAKPALYHLAKENGAAGRQSLTGNHFPVWIADSAMLWTAGDDGPILFNPVSGQVYWTATVFGERISFAERKFVPVRTGGETYNVPVERGGGDVTPPGRYTGHAPPVVDLDRNLAYLAYQQALVAVDLTNGHPYWPSMIMHKSKVERMWWFDFGVLVATEDGLIDLVDPATGETIWLREFSNNSSPAHVVDSFLYVCDSTDVLAIHIPTGEERLIGSGLEFKFHESAQAVEPVDTGYLVYSQYNVFRLDAGGRVTSHFVSDQGRGGFLSDLALGLLIVGLAVATVAVVGSGSGGGSGGGYQPIFIPVHRTRYTFYPDSDPPEHRGAYLFVAVKNGVVLVNRATGLPEHQVRLGEMHDRYLIDPVHLRLFLKSKDRKSIVCYSSPVEGQP